MVWEAYLVYYLTSAMKRKFDRRCMGLKCAFSTGNCMFKVKNKNTRTRCEICSYAIGVVLVSSLLSLNIFHTLVKCFYC